MENMVMIKTNSGFECSINKDAMDDMRILDALVDLQNGNKMEQVVALRTILERLMGMEQKEAFYTHLEEKEGRASISAAYVELLDLFKKIGEAGKK